MASIFSLESLQALLAHNAGAMHRVRFAEVACALGALCAVFAITRARRTKTTALRGPPSASSMWGVDHLVAELVDQGLSYERWAEEYGGVFEIPSTFGKKKIILCDPKAIAHYFAGEPFTYVVNPGQKIAIEKFLGKGIFTAAGEDHRRQRKALAPAFTNVAIRNLTPVFYDSAYKCKSAWDTIIDSHSGRSAVIDVEEWMNHISLDSMGIAGFAHDFGTLDGKTAAIVDALEVFGNIQKESIVNQVIVLLSMLVPWLRHMPTPLTEPINRLNAAITDISNELIAKCRREKEAGGKEEKSILGLLIRNENQSGQRRITSEEVMAQVKALLLAGYESTSVSMTWALIEMCRNKDIQTKLRAELLALGDDPTHDQLLTSLPYLDAVVHETLRVHPAIGEAPRMAAKDDVIPLSKPVQTQSGELVDHITVSKGTYLLVSNTTINRSEAIWGPDAKEFKPERWLQEGIPAMAKEVQGYRHLLSFIDGPRICLGKGFAVSEFKIAMSVLVKNFSFEFVDGPDTPIDLAFCILPRPKLASSDRIVLPMRVTRLE